MNASSDMPTFHSNLNIAGSFQGGVGLANQIIENRLRQQQLDQNYDLQNRQMMMQEQAVQREAEQQKAFQSLAQEAYKQPDLILPQLYARDPLAAQRISDGIQQQYTSQYNTLKLLTDSKAENKQATYDLLKPELQRQFPELQFGDKYSTELNNSLKARAAATKAKMKTNLEFRDTAQGITAFNPQTGESQFTGIAGKPNESSNGGATGALIRQLQKENPGMTTAQALYIIQTGNRSGTKIDASGNVVPMGGATNAKTAVKQAEKLGTDLGEAQAKALANLGNTEDNAGFILKQLDEIKTHPGLKGSVGIKGGGALFGNIGSDKVIPGSPEADFISRMNQIEGEAFLQAFDTLKGGGAITEAEGNKATQARLRMSRATSEKDFIAAANDFEDVVRTGLERQRKQAKGEFGTQIKKEEKANNSSLQEGRTATNPKTGEKIIFKGGKWQPL